MNLHGDQNQEYYSDVRSDVPKQIQEIKIRRDKSTGFVRNLYVIDMAGVEWLFFPDMFALPDEENDEVDWVMVGANKRIVGLQSTSVPT